MALAYNYIVPLSIFFIDIHQYIGAGWVTNLMGTGGVLVINGLSVIELLAFNQTTLTLTSTEFKPW